MVYLSSNQYIKADRINEIAVKSEKVYSVKMGTPETLKMEQFC